MHFDRDCRFRLRFLVEYDFPSEARAVEGYEGGPEILIGLMIKLLEGFEFFLGQTVQLGEPLGCLRRLLDL